MNNLVLERVVAALAPRARGALIVALVEEGPWRVRLDLRSADASELSVTVCYRPGSPWLAAGPPRPRLAPRPGGFAAKAAGELRGRIVEEIAKPASDRTVTWTLRDGIRLVAQMVTGSPNLLLLGAAGEPLVAARKPRAHALQHAALDPFRATADELERTIEATLRTSEEPAARAIARSLAGLAPADV
jgi:hypothetical protein